MRIQQVLVQLERVESEMASFYEWLSEVFESDGEASGLFFRMSLQEKSHASLLKYGRKLVYRSPSEFDDVDFDETAIASLSALLAEFRTGHPKPSLAEALFFAMKIEGHPAENGHRDVLTISNPEISQMIKSLAVADEEHHQTLRAFAHQRAAEFD
jgi:rubrerythrin